MSQLSADDRNAIARGVATAVGAMLALFVGFGAIAYLVFNAHAERIEHRVAATERIVMEEIARIRAENEKRYRSLVGHHGATRKEFRRRQRHE